MLCERVMISIVHASGSPMAMSSLSPAIDAVGEDVAQFWEGLRQGI